MHIYGAYLIFVHLCIKARCVSSGSSYAVEVLILFQLYSSSFFQIVCKMETGASAIFIMNVVLYCMHICKYICSFSNNTMNKIFNLFYCFNCIP